MERGRRATADLFAGLIKRYSFGSRDVDPAVARFAERLIEAHADRRGRRVLPGVHRARQDARRSPRFADMPVLVLAGDKDLVTPSEHSEAIADLLPDAELVLVPDAGHLVMLEHPEVVTDRLADLLVAAPGAVPGSAATVGRLWKHRAARPLQAGTTRPGADRAPLHRSPSTPPSRCGSWAAGSPSCCAPATW